MMQETGPEWTPMYEGHLPWGVRLFILYLLVVGIYAVVQWGRLGWFLWRTRDTASNQLRANTETSQFDFLKNWQLALVRVVCLKRAVKTTILLAVLVLTGGAADILQRITLEKRVGIAGLAGGAAYEVLFPVSFGIMVCAVLYASSALFDTWLQRRKIFWNTGQNRRGQQPVPPETKPPLLPSN